MGQHDTCFSASPLAWKWILEKLVDNKNVGKPILKGLSGYVKDIEEPHCRPLLRRLALRYLEESIANDRLDSSIIPLVKAASEVDTLDSRLLASQRSRDKKLLVRVKTEAVISWIRKESDGEVVDWDAFAQTLNEAFSPDDLDPETCTQRKELLAALAGKDETVVAKHPIQRLRKDLLHFIKQKKASLDQPVLDQIATSYFDESLQKKSYILAEAQKGSDGGDAHVKLRTRCQAPLSDIVNHAKELFGMREMEARLAPTTEVQLVQPIEGRQVLPKLIQSEVCVESREDYVDLQDKCTELQCQVRQSSGPIATRDDQSSQVDEGTNTSFLCNLSAHGDTRTQPDGRKRRRESVEMVDVACVNGKDTTQLANSTGNLLKLRRTVNCFECSMGGSLLFCDTCDSSYHLECLGSQLTCKWTCPNCGHLCTVPESKLLPTPPPLDMRNNRQEVYPCLLRTEVGTEVSKSAAAALAQYKEPGASLPLGSTAPENGDPSTIEISENHSGGCVRSETLEKWTAGPSAGNLPNMFPAGSAMRSELLHEEVAGPSSAQSGRNAPSPLPGLTVRSESLHKETTSLSVTVSAEILPKPLPAGLAVKNLGMASFPLVRHRDVADHATGSSFVKRANSSDDDDDVEIIESLSCKRPKTRTFINIEDDPVVTMAGATNVIAHSESIAPEVLPKGTGTGGTPQSSKTYNEGGNSLMENENVGKSMIAEDEETAEMQKVIEMQRLHFPKDGQEQVCCICGDVGSLLTCDGCPIGMHLDCIAQGQAKVHVGDGQSCPFCMSEKALQAVLNAKRAAKLAQKQFMEAKKILAQLHDGMPQKHEGIERENLNKSRMQQIGNESANHNAQQHVGADVNSAEAISGQHGHPLAQPLPDASNICDGQNGKAFLPQNAVPKSESPKAEVDGERHDGDVEQTSRPMKPKKMSSGRKAVPGLRRKALPWTPQEEKALRDGVMKYSHDGGRWGFQWQRILESGFGVFDPSRTGVDLKDKWRNMQRRASPT